MNLNQAVLSQTDINREVFVMSNLNGKYAIVTGGGNFFRGAELQQAGIENFIHVRVNVLETLKGLNAKLGI